MSDYDNPYMAVILIPKKAADKPVTINQGDLSEAGKKVLYELTERLTNLAKK